MIRKLHHNQQDIIKHIKFITHDLFKDQIQRKSPFKDSYKTNHTRIKSPQRTLDSCQCYHRKRSKADLPSSASPDNKEKPPLFESFDKFWSENQHPKKRKPIIDQINKTIYKRFVEENRGRQLMQSRRTVDGEQLWRDFLKRQGEWVEGKKQMIRTAQIVQQARLRESRSLKKSKRRVATNAEHQWGEVQKGIRELRLKTQQLKFKVFQISSKEKEREKTTPFVKTFQKGQ